MPGNSRYSLDQSIIKNERIKNDLRIDMLGTSFSISAEENAVYLEGLLNQYRVAVENTQRSTGLKDPLKASILTGFLLCDEIQKMRKREVETQEHEARETEQITLDLIARIDEILEDKIG